MESRSDLQRSSYRKGVLRTAASKAMVLRPLATRTKNDMFESGGDVSEDESSSSGSSWGRNRAKARGDVRRRQQGVKPVKIVPEGDGEALALSSLPLEPAIGKRRCTWITSYSESLYVCFHDEEWGVPVYDDQRLFELLILSAALSEFSWPTILNRRDKFRKFLDNFEPASVANFNEKKIQSLKSSGSLLSEPKLRAVVENARQMLKNRQRKKKKHIDLRYVFHHLRKQTVIEEFGSFSNYCWSFVNRKPIINGFRYVRQVPAKSPKAELISKDLMRRGFRCVGPTIIYSFMQAAGIVNDHLSSCFRFRDCTDLYHNRLRANADAALRSKPLNQACKIQA